jgi:hypothetical protein
MYVAQVKVEHFSLLNHGGAYTAAKRLVNAQISLGIDATLETNQEFKILQKIENPQKFKIFPKI